MADPIKHVIVLMLENQSFDRLVGLTPGVDGVNPKAPLANPETSTGKSIPQNLSTQPRMDFDPPHDYDDVMAQLAGKDGPCSGFVDSFIGNNPKGNPSEIMAYYDRDYLPSLGTLAQQFVTCDRWFSSVPGPTWPNRFFVNSGTSLGHIDMPNLAHFDPAVHLYDQPTVFERLSEAGHSWRIYFSDFSQTLLMIRQEAYAANYRYFSTFESDCEDEASFPEYAFIEPRFFSPGENDQHPTSDIRRGDALIAQVYNAIRQNQSLWESTLLIILYDEHGGFFEHVDPRQPQYKAKALPPDGNKTPEGFAFDLFGLRVPAVLVSPLLDPAVLHGVYDHTSVLCYLTEKFSLGALGARVPTANNFADELVWRERVRDDPPPSLHVTMPPEDPKPTGLSEHQEALVAYSRYLESRMAKEPLPQGKSPQEFQQDIAQRTLQTVEDVTQHGPVAAERLRLFLNSRGANLPPR